MRIITLACSLFLAGCIVQGGSQVTGGGNAADSQQVTKLKKRLEQLESRVERMGLSGGSAATSSSEPAQVGGTLRMAVTEPNTLNDILDVRDWVSM